MFRTALFAVAVLAASAGVPALADDTDVKLEDLPQAVRATVDREVGDGTIDDIDKVEKTELYEVEFKRDGKEFEMLIRKDGTLVSKKEDDDGDDD